MKITDEVEAAIQGVRQEVPEAFRALYCEVAAQALEAETMPYLARSIRDGSDKPDAYFSMLSVPRAIEVGFALGMLANQENSLDCIMEYVEAAKEPKEEAIPPSAIIHPVPFSVPEA